MNLPFCADLETVKKSAQLIPSPVEKKSRIPHIYTQFSTAKNIGRFWLFGTYPSFQPYYDSYC